MGWLALLVVAINATPGRVLAQSDSVSGAYQVTFERVASNCKPANMTLSTSTLRFAQRGDQISVTMPTLPVMVGEVGNQGRKFKAQAQGPAPGDGMDGRFSVAGRRIGERGIELLFIAEFYRDKKPLCTQSFSGSGTRQK